MTQNALQAVLDRERYLAEKGEASPSLTGLDAVWLAEARIDKEQARRWGKAEVEFWLNTETGLDAVEIALLVPSLIGLGLWIETRQLVESHPGFGTESFKPRAATRIAYALARDPALAHDSNSAPMRQARAYMKRHMSCTFLARGGADEAMHWLRLTEWRDGESGFTPRETLLRAYAYMPQVEPPEDMRAEIAAIDARV